MEKYKIKNKENEVLNITIITEENKKYIYKSLSEIITFFRTSSYLIAVCIAQFINYRFLGNSFLLILNFIIFFTFQCFVWVYSAKEFKKILIDVDNNKFNEIKELIEKEKNKQI